MTASAPTPASPVRVATLADLDALVELRLQLFACFPEALGKVADDTMRRVSQAYFTRAFEQGDCHTWVAEADNRIVAQGSLALFQRPPFPANLSGREAYLLNMYTLPDYRRRGYSKAILQQAMAFAREQGLGRIWLHASENGQPLYAQAGFQPSSKFMEWIPC